MLHALTIDVEDYFQVAAFFGTIGRNDWSSYPYRCGDNTRRILDLLDRHDCRATFFVLGWIAEHDPALVREIDARGHEIGCHGFSHEFVFRQTPEEFRSETLRAKAFLEDTIGKPVPGYRAASYSIVRRSAWALDTLMEAGFAYDSSIFPVHHDNYGVPGAPEVPHRAATAGGEILEFPLTTAAVGPWRLPVAGGGYFRLYPYAVTSYFVHRHGRDREDPFIFYLHPWEVDPAQPRIEGARMRSRFRHYLNLGRTEQRLDRLLTDHAFAPLGDFVDRYAQRELISYRYDA